MNISMESTTDYDVFKLSDLNRKGGVDKNQVNHLIEKITEKNLLKYNPIIVDKEFNILQGQHRLQAAKELGIPIYYIIADDVEIEDMISLNNAKPWRNIDYLNFYAKTGKEEYIKLRDFIASREIPEGVGITLAVGLKGSSIHNFRNGKFEFYEGLLSDDIEIVIEVINSVDSSVKGNKGWILSARFWKAVICLVRNPSFDIQRMKENIKILSHQISAKPSYQQYLKFLQDIHNYNKRTNRISIEDMQWTV